MEAFDWSGVTLRLDPELLQVAAMKPFVGCGQGFQDGPVLCFEQEEHEVQ